MARAKALKMNVEDRPGVLGEVASALGGRGINVRAIHAYTEQGRGTICVVVDKLAAATKVLASRGLDPKEEDLLELELINKPGALGEVSKKLGDAGVNIRYVFVGAGGGRRTTVYLAVSEIGKAMKAVR